MKDVLYIPGGFDVLHSDHKKYIKKCFDAASKQFKINKVIIGLISDTDLQVKGEERSLFSYEWRREDLIDLAKNNFKDVELKVEKLNMAGYKKFPRNNEIAKRIIAISSEHENISIIRDLCAWHVRVIFINPLGSRHTSDIPNEVFKLKETSGCFIRKVAVAVVRSGSIVKVTKNGTNNGCLKESCNKFKDIMATHRKIGKKLPSDIPCSFSHAEIKALKYSKEGDSLITTTSPCMECAKQIATKKVKRVVYFEEYHDFAPIVFLKKHGVACRKAGVKK